MADVKLKSLKFPGLPNRYVIPTDAEDFTFENENLADVLQKKANIDGFYDELTAGSAEQLISSQFVEDSEPYKFRTTGGSADVGNREQVDAIVGGSIAWNQLVQNGNFADASNWSHYPNRGTLTISNGVAKITPSAPNEQLYQSMNLTANHVYLTIAVIRSEVNNYILGLATGDRTWISASTSWKQFGLFTKPATTGSDYTYISDPQAGGWWEVRSINVFDLTQMFGSSVADAVYAMEQGNAGAGVKWFKSLFPNDYYEYNAGELISVSGLQSHDTVGFNQWDEEWEVGGLDSSSGQPYASTNYIRSKNYSPCVPSTNYTITHGSSQCAVFWYDADKNYISFAYDNAGSSFGVIASPSNACWFKVRYGGSGVQSYDNSVCISITWSGWRNGEYEPYQKHSYPLDSSLTLRGVPKLSADNKMYYDGDEYLSDGSVTRKYKIVTYNGSENWGAESGGTYSGQNFFVEKPSDALPYSAGLEYAQKFLTAVAVSSDVLTDNTLVPSSGYFNFAIGARLGITTVADFKTYLASHPISVLYPIATPTTETADPYTKVQTCDDFGTEEYVSTSIVPVGHNTEYPANLRDKLQHLPDLADNDGYYMIKQASKQMSLEPFRIPKAPSENGTYVLKATVSGGTPTYTWVEEN